jgi:Ca2+-binding EF-hand superfamily protein
MQDLRNIDELLYNPFAGRIAEVFSDDGTSRLTFKNFLELFAVFSPQANFDVKGIFLFAIWDFDGAHIFHTVKWHTLCCRGNTEHQAI